MLDILMFYTKTLQLDTLLCEKWYFSRNMTLVWQVCEELSEVLKHRKVNLMVIDREAQMCIKIWLFFEKHPAQMSIRVG